MYARNSRDTRGKHVMTNEACRTKIPLGNESGRNITWKYGEYKYY
jgi:hypothetical protein